MNPIISVIVPVYNTESYLRCCINSILAQTFTDFELLLVDDGSTDQSGVICDEYARQDSRVRVFHKSNSGVSSARNVGLENAIGKWIAFVDSDDELLPQGLERFAEGWKGEKEIDFISAGYEYYPIEGEQFSTLRQGKEEKILDVNQSVMLMYRDRFYQFYVFTKLFKRSVILNNSLHFDETLYFSEDRLFIINYLCAMSGKMFCTTKPVYKYIVRQTGAMMSLVGRFNYKSVTGYEAAVKMYHCLNDCSIITEEVKKIASFDVIYSYNITRKAMNKYNVCDKKLVDRLNSELKSVLSFGRYVIVLLKLYIKFIIIHLF